ncbi:MAG TPA: hypothetical protein V6C65_01700 [Allocoleopsis sp.]
MSRGFGATNSNNNEHKATERPNTNQQTEQQPSFADPVEQVRSQADVAISGLEQARLNYAAAAISRHAEKLEMDSDQIAKTLQTLMNPELAVALGELKAANAINNRSVADRPLPVGNIGGVPLQIPGIPSFGNFYSSASQSAPQLAASTSGNEQNGQNNESIEQPHL